MPSPLCSVKVGVAAYVPAIPAVAMTAGATIVIRLDTPAGVSSWEIECVSTDELSSKATVNAGLTIDQGAKTATFTAPVAGRAYLFRSRVELGRNNGKEDPTYSSTFKVFTPTAGGLQVGAVGETTESNPSFGWTGVFNGLIRTGGGGGSTPSGTGFRHVTGGVEDAAAVLIVDADVNAAAAIAGSKLQAAAAGNKGAIQLAQDIGGTATAPTVVGISGASGVVTHVETVHQLLTANQRLRDERFEFSLTGSADLVWSLAIPTGESWIVDYELVAHVVGGGNTNVYRATRKIKNVAGTLTVTTIGTDTASEDLGGTIDYTTTGTTVRLRYTKPTGTWRCVGRVTIDGAVA